HAPEVYPRKLFPGIQKDGRYRWRTILTPTHTTMSLIRMSILMTTVTMITRILIRGLQAQSTAMNIRTKV
ncbi:MAG: hypothetical protein WBW03_14555, partial [Silvibacterium sp.]